MKQISIACLFIAVLSRALLAQTPAHAPTPSPELKKQDFFVGTWRLEGATKSSPLGPGGQKFDSTEQLEWMPGGFFLLAHSYSHEKLVGVTIIGYSNADRIFTHTSFNSSGETELWKGTAEDDSWTWTRDRTTAGKPAKERLTIKKTSPSSYSFADEVQLAEGGNWFTVAEGTGTREK